MDITCKLCGKSLEYDGEYFVDIDGEPVATCDVCYDAIVYRRSRFTLPTTEQQIMEAAESVAAMLIDKNRRYGDSALNQLGIFNKSTTSGSISSRIDDKLARIKNSESLARDDLFDLIGYLVLLQIERGWVGYGGDEKL
jgi:ribosome-binding protein aMBF1 (putative translation factor)